MCHGLAALCCVVLQTAIARPDGQPWPDACETLSPGNGIPPQTGPMPFSLTVDDHKVHNDECIYVTIKGEEPEEFAGFMIQARNKSDIAVGKFLEADDVKLADCFGSTENTAININYLPKEEVIVRWFPERGYIGPVTIYATIAKDYMEQVYWLKAKTKPIRVTRSKYKYFD